MKCIIQIIIYSSIHEYIISTMYLMIAEIFGQWWGNNLFHEPFISLKHFQHLFYCLTISASTTKLKNCEKCFRSVLTNILIYAFSDLFCDWKFQIYCTINIFFHKTQFCIEKTLKSYQCTWLVEYCDVVFLLVVEWSVKHNKKVWKNNIQYICVITESKFFFFHTKMTQVCCKKGNPNIWNVHVWNGLKNVWHSSWKILLEYHKRTLSGFIDVLVKSLNKSCMEMHLVYVHIFNLLITSMIRGQVVLRKNRY